MGDSKLGNSKVTNSPVKGNTDGHDKIFVDQL